ncbi:Peroxisomal membrane protein PEX28 [Vanrija pseudolonga]|uniref:Peroxisomal membrane protein PEX28 n=1 Tax=Vanrija pseudolonga TaxID=143232 RepID=A0AAF0XZ57_9TREE|nr:Peroxisomal membrane protein PEX28 [Vanrija pseudolonga]
MDASVPPYIPVPSAAVLIGVPADLPTAAEGATSSSSPNTLAAAAGAAGGSGTAAASRTRAPAFPPAVAAANAASASAASRKFTVPGAAALSSNVSDMVLSSLLPPNLPRLAQTHHAPGRARDLTSQKEGLGLNVMSNNFRRFLTKVGPIVWLQDRVEEVLFWQKPLWTWAWMALWAFICFFPRILLLLPSAILLVTYLTFQEQKEPLPSLFGVLIPSAPDAGTQRVGDDPSTSYSASTVEGKEGVPQAPPGDATSTTDILMNMQAIQNLMGVIADVFEAATPWLNYIAGKDTSPTSFPLTPTVIVLLLLPPTLLLPLTPGWAIPYLLLPAGWAGPLLFHPNLTHLLEHLPRSRAALQRRAELEDAALTDALPDDLGRRPIARVEVWENERLDPIVSAKPTAAAQLPAGAYSSRFLRPGERGGWVKVRTASGTYSHDAIWEDEEDRPESGDRMALALKDKWSFVPGEDWRVDVCGLWSEVGTDPGE